MKIIFYSNDDPIHRLVEALEGDIHLAQSEEKTLELLEDVADDEECLLFLDFDIGPKEMEKFNKSIFKNEWITRIVISGRMKVKEFKKHQKGKTAAHGYVLKPLTGQVLNSILNDLEISHLLEEQNLYEEGTRLPDLPSSSQALQGLDSLDSELSDQGDSEEDDFGAQEFKMNTQVRNLVDLHSVKGDTPPFESDLNDNIQEKFDEVFGTQAFEDNENVGQEDNFIGGGGVDGGLSLREETQESIELSLGDESTEISSGDLGAGLGSDDEEIDLEADLDIGGDDEELDLSADDDGGELDLGIDDEELDLSADDDGGELDLGIDDEELDLSADDDGGEVDLGADDEELDLSADDDGGELDLGIDDEELDLSADDDGNDGGELSFNEGETSASEEDLEEELNMLTEERALPSQEELAEFEEETGDIDISPLENSEEMSFDKPGPVDPVDSDLGLDDTGDFSLDSTQEEGPVSANDTASSSEEDLSMSDDNQDNDELLEFDDEELAEDGELAFNTESEPEDSSESEEDEGGLDFNLGAIDDEEMDLEAGPASDEDDPEALEVDDGEGGFSLDDVGGGEDDAPVSDDDGMDLDISGGDEDFDLGDDAVLGADSHGDDLSMDASGEEAEDEEVEASTTQDEDSEFDDDELSFIDDEDDDEIEKTQAVSLNQMQAEATGEVNNEDDALDDLGELDSESDFDLSAEDDADEDIEALDTLDSDGADEDIESGDELSAAEDLFEENELSNELPDDDFGEDTNPTVVMTDDVTKDLENMVDQQVTNEFRPGMEDNDTALLDEEELYGEEDDFDSLGQDDDQVTPSAVEEAPEVATSEVENVSTPASPASQEEGTLNITPAEHRVPPSFNEGEAVRLQATIRQLREEREDLLKEIQDLKKDKKLMDQDNLGLKAELDEAKIEISILKKRHSTEVDEMKYRLRITDEKKLYAEEKARKLQKEFDRLQSKVRIDFNQIKQREKELESQLELAKMDSESQVQSRDKKILELKRKIDQLEFNMENIVIKEQKSRDDKMKLEERLERIMKTLRGSIEVLEDDIDFDKEGKRNRD